MASRTDRTKIVARDLSRVGAELQSQWALAKELSRQYDMLTDDAEDTDAELLIEEKAAEILLLLEDQWRKAFEEHASDVISEGLTHVFGEDLHFRMLANVRGGTSALRFELETPNGSADIMKAEGGSLVQVASFLLRVIFTLGLQMRKVIVLDEAFAGMSEENVPNLALLLRDIVAESGIQLIMVTHDKSYIEVADAVYEVDKKDGDEYAQVSCIKSDNTVVVDD